MSTYDVSGKMKRFIYGKLYIFRTFYYFLLGFVIITIGLIIMPYLMDLLEIFKITGFMGSGLLIVYHLFVLVLGLRYFYKGVQISAYDKDDI